MNKERIIEELSLRPFGAKGWWSSESMRRPNCGKNDKFGILFAPQGGATHCFYECGKNISLYKFLVSIDRKDLIGSTHIKQKLKQQLPSIYEEEKDEEETTEEIKIKLPQGYEAQIRPRSGMSVKTWLDVKLSTIDSDYIGYIGVIVWNNSVSSLTIEDGERIAQMIVAKTERVEWERVGELEETERGEGGFGHTGTKIIA